MWSSQYKIIRIKQKPIPFLRSSQFSRKDDSDANSNITWWYKPYVHVNNKALLKFRENIWDERGRDISKGI